MHYHAVVSPLHVCVLQAASAAARADGQLEGESDGQSSQSRPWFAKIVGQLQHYARARASPTNCSVEPAILIQRMAQDVAVPLAAWCATGYVEAWWGDWVVKHACPPLLLRAPTGGLATLAMP